VPGLPLDVVVLGDHQTPPPESPAEPVVYAPAADLRSPMTLGRRWWRGTPSGPVETAEDNTAAVRWLLRHRSATLDGPPATELVAEVGADAVRTEALGAARDLAERFEDGEPSAADRHRTVAVCFSLLHRAATGEVASDAEARRTAASLLGPDQGLRALVWETHRLCGELALSRRSP
jgi:hypothetical protein